MVVVVAAMSYTIVFSRGKSKETRGAWGGIRGSGMKTTHMLKMDRWNTNEDEYSFVVSIPLYYRTFRIQ